MLKRLFFVLLLVLTGMMAVVAVKTILYSKPIPVYPSAEMKDVFDSSAIHLSQAIQIKTVSFGDTLSIDTAEFQNFRVFLETTYPAVHTQLPRQIFSEFSYVFTWLGKNTSLKPYVIMAHMDVVPVEAAVEKNWTAPPFSGLIKGDTIWGRGAVDDKASVIGILEAAEQLLRDGFQPERTIYLCFGHDEEIAGKRGMAKIAAWFQQQGIQPELVLDEGGMVSTEQFTELRRPVAFVGVGEKGYVNIDLTVEKPGGHSSMPVTETAIDILNNAIARVRAQQMPARLTDPILQMFERIGPGSSLTNRIALSNQWLFKNLVISNLEKTKESNAQVHTTIVPTIVKAGIKDNVIPSVAKATLNSRILTGETSDDVVKFVTKVINDERVQVKKQTISLMEPSTLTASDHPMFRLIESNIYQTLPNVIVTPYLIVGATDSRYFRPFSSAVVNFIPVTNAKGYHGIDERIAINDLKRMVFFYKRTMQGTAAK